MLGFHFSFVLAKFSKIICDKALANQKDKKTKSSSNPGDSLCDSEVCSRSACLLAWGPTPQQGSELNRGVNTRGADLSLEAVRNKKYREGDTIWTQGSRMLPPGSAPGCPAGAVTA